MSGKPQPKRITSYQYYFDKVYLKRLRYLNKICILLALLLSVLLQIPYGGFWWNLLLTLYRAPLVFLALWLVKICRNNNSTVDFSKRKTLGHHIMHCVFTRRYVTTLLFFLGSSHIINTVFLLQLPLKSQYYVLAKEYRQKPAINDEWVYYWFHAYFVATIYTAQHLVFQRNRLQFKYGVNSVKPESVLFSNIPTLLGNALVFNTVSSIAAPVIYYVARSIIYKLNWLIFAILSLDSAIPPYHIAFGTLTNVSFVSLFVFFLWEIVNHVYNIYATIGCLDGAKPISSYSSDPISTLLSGLRDVEPENQLSRLTAFQELAYLSITKDPEGEKRRNAIFNAHSNSGFVWPAILDECALVIKDVSSRINYRSKSDMDALSRTQLSLKEDVNMSSLQLEKFIFGNSFDLSMNDTAQATTATSSPLKKYEDAFTANKPAALGSIEKLYLYQYIAKAVGAPIKTFVVSFVNPQTSKAPTSIGQKLQNLQQFYVKYHEQFLSSSFGIFFRITLKRDAESRVVNPVNYGNAVIALAGLLIHAVEEDRNHTVTNNHISEVLNLLERPIRACANYTDFLPASIYLSPEQRGNEQKTKHHMVALLHDLTMHEFFQLCVKYNYKLNDLLLSSRAFKLAKWVIDASIAQQQKQNHSYSANFF